MKRDIIGRRSKASPILGLISGLIFLNILSGCATHTKSLSNVEYFKSVKEAADLLKARQNSIDTFSAMARIQIDSKRGRRGIRELITIAGSDWLRLESLNILGQPYLTIVKNREEVNIYNAEEGRFYREADNRNTIYNLTGLNLSGKEISRIITQRFLSEGEQVLSLRKGEKEKESSILTIGKDNWETIEIKLGVGFHPISTIHKDKKGAIMERVYYSNYKKLSSSLYFPQNIRVEFPADGFSLNIRLFDIEINKLIDEEVFRLEMLPLVKSKR